MDKPSTLGSIQKSPTFVTIEDVPTPAPSFTKYRWLNHVPWVAVSAITLATLCLFASAIIVGMSNGQIAAWGLQPHVVLGVLSSVATASLVVSLSSGVAITWWQKAHNGIEANSLHSIWSYSPMGGGAYSMVRHGFKNMNRIAVASTLTAIAGIVYSPLLQKSSGVASANIGINVLKNLFIVPKLPDNYTGYNYGKFYGSIGVYDEFSAVVQRWSLNNNPAALDKQGFACNGTCIGSVPSAGISWTCSNTTTIVPLTWQGPNSSFYGLSTNYTRTLDTAGDPMLLMTIAFIDSVDPSNCNANLITKTCNISAGTVSFPTKMINTTLLTNEKSMPITNFHPTPYEGDKPHAKEDSNSGPLGGLAWLGYNFFWTADQISYDNSSTFTDLINGTMSVTYYDYDFQFPDSDPPSFGQNASCNYRWFDPSSDILNAFSEILFWASVDAMNQSWFNDGSLKPTTFEVEQTNERLVYTAVYPFLIVAECVLMAAIVSVATTLYGWWHLDREVSMNPLETARAIKAGMFDDARPGAESRELLRMS